MNQTRAAKHTLLVIDDDPAVRHSLKFSLEIEGFEVYTYSSGTKLLNDGNLPVASILIVNYRMPEINGLELVAKLRDRGISTPAILITGHPNDSLRQRATAAGVSVVEMPFLGNVLIERIYHILAEHPRMKV